MKRSFIKYSVFVFCLLTVLILYFIYDTRKQYQQHRVDQASEDLNMDLDYKDVEALDEAWENIDRAMEKADIDTIRKNKNRR